MKKSILNKAITTSFTLGASMLISMPVVQAGVRTYDWDGLFTMLDSGGVAMGNPSITSKGSNLFQTPVSGTMAFDTVTGAGTATMVPFDFFSGSLPAEAVSINLQAIGDGAGGYGTLIMGNMLFNWSGINDIPASIVLDAAGFMGAEAIDWADGSLDNTDAAVIDFGAMPASDGTYVGINVPGTVTGPGGYAGYLGLGPLPIVTTAWNASLSAGCLVGADRDFSNNDGGGCMGVATSSILPLVFDTATNTHDYTANTGGSIGGNPMADGPFTGLSPNFDVTTLTATGYDPSAIISPFCDFAPHDMCPPPSVPLPASVWLFGSGLIGLIGFARRKTV